MYKKNNSFDVCLRGLNKKNISNFYQNWMHDENVNRFLESRFKNYTQKELAEYIDVCNNDKNIILRGIFVNNKHIGNIKLDIDNNHKFAFLGILIGDKNFHNQGIGKQAVCLMISLAREIKLNKILVGVYANNIASLDLFECIGFNQSGLFKKHYIFDGVYVDKVVMEYIL